MAATNPLTVAGFDAALKVRYTPQTIRNMVYKNHPLFAALAKMEDFGGSKLPIPIIVSTPAGRSASFAKAQANKLSGLYNRFDLTRVSDYGLCSISTETLEASVGDVNSFLRAQVVEIDGILVSLTRSLATALYRSGTGSIGVIGSGFNTATVTLATPDDVVGFEVGMKIAASATDGSALRNGGATVTLIAVDRSAGTLTAAAAWTASIAALANGDFLYVDGDAANAGANVKVAGLDAWLPSTAPGATLFFGVDRSVDTSRLGGLRYDGSAETIEEALIGGAALAFREGGHPDTGFMNPVDHGNLMKSLGSKVIFDIVKSSDGKIGFDAIKLMGAAGTMKIVADPDCPRNVCYMLQMDTWKLYSLGAAPKIQQPDGLRMLREATADSVEIRSVYYGNLGCQAPGWNVRVKLA